MLGTTAEDGFQGFEEWIVANHGGDVYKRQQGDRQEDYRPLPQGMQGPRGDSGLRRRLDKPRRGGMRCV